MLYEVITGSEDGYDNDGPSTTGISGKALMGFAPQSGVNYSITQASSNFNGDADYFISFKFSVADISEALQGTGHTFTSSTPFRFITGTAAQDNSFNQDLNGMDDSGWTSDGTCRITSYNVCYTKLLRFLHAAKTLKAMTKTNNKASTLNVLFFIFSTLLLSLVN